MSTKRTGTSFSVRFLRNGDKIEFERNVYTDGGIGANLFQIVDIHSGSVTPDWTVESKQPIISLTPKTASGLAVAVTDVTWKVGGVTLSFNYSSTDWVWANGDPNSGFKAKKDANGNFKLRICKNLCSKNDTSAKIIEYEVRYKSGNMEDVFRDSVECAIHIAGTNAHIVQIAVDPRDIASARGGITLGNYEYNDGTEWKTVEITETTLRAACYYAADEVKVDENGYTMKWYKDGAELSLTTPQNELLVERDDVDGGSVFVARLFKDGKVVAQDGQRINDVNDEYQVAAAPASGGNNYVSVSRDRVGNIVQTNATYLLVLTKNGEVVNGDVNFSWQVYNAIGEEKTEGTGATVTVTPADCLIKGAVGSADAVYDDADVQVTAEFS